MKTIKYLFFLSILHTAEFLLIRCTDVFPISRVLMCGGKQDRDVFLAQMSVSGRLLYSVQASL